MKPSRTNILTFGTSVRQAALFNYNNFGTEGGAKMTRRMVWEGAKVLAEMHGDADAAAILYSVADSIANKVPIENFQIALLAPPPAKTQEVTGGGRGLTQVCRPVPPRRRGAVRPVLPRLRRRLVPREPEMRRAP